MITQGHKYMHGSREVLAMENKTYMRAMVRVAEIDRKLPYPLLPATMARACDLQPLPMVYFGGEVPK